MSFSGDVLRNDEKAIYNLRELYRRYGYSHYKVGRFEEYDLYAHNKSFLVSENILTFTDTNGKLMALKPDVTLSIIKNISSDDTSMHKLYYNENVYRTSAESHGFKEIMQTGLECVGSIDLFSESEVVMLAMRSLESISDDCILDVSHMGLVEGLLDEAGFDGERRNIALGYIKSKNAVALEKFVCSVGINSDISSAICALTQMYLPLSEALVQIGELAVGDKMRAAYDELCGICDIMKLYGLSDRLYFDFSVVNDRNYYDGVIFKGFINGIPESVLSGGRYDRLLTKMGKSCGAIGFAVYLDRLERFGADDLKYDADVLLLYTSDTDTGKLIEAVKSLADSGKTVRTAKELDGTASYKQVLRLGKGGLESLEAND